MDARRERSVIADLRADVESKRGEITRAIAEVKRLKEELTQAERKLSVFTGEPLPGRQISQQGREIIQLAATLRGVRRRTGENSKEALALAKKLEGMKERAVKAKREMRNARLRRRHAERIA